MIPLVLGAASGGVPEEAGKRLRELAGIPFGSRRGPVGRTLTYLVMSTDDSGGRIVDGERQDPGGLARVR